MSRKEEEVTCPAPGRSRIPELRPSGAPRPPRPGARSPPVHRSQRPGRAAARRGGRGAGGAGRAGGACLTGGVGSGGAPGLGQRPPSASRPQPQSARRRPPDNAHKQGGAAAAGTSRLWAAGPGTPSPPPKLLLPQPPRLPPPPLAAGTHGPQSHQLRFSADGRWHWDAQCACLQNRSGKEAGLAPLSLAGGIEWQPYCPAPSESKLRNKVPRKLQGRCFFEASTYGQRPKNKEEEWRASVLIGWWRPL